MVGYSFLEGFGRNWWGLLLRGILAILFGVMAFVMPSLTLLTLALIYGAYALLDGIVSIWFGASSHAWGLVMFGLLGIGIGIYTLYVPWGTAVALLYMIGAWAVLRGVFEIVTAIQLRKEIDNEWSLVMSGIISIVLGFSLPCQAWRRRSCTNLGHRSILHFLRCVVNQTRASRP